MMACDDVAYHMLYANNIQVCADSCLCIAYDTLQNMICVTDAISPGTGSE